METYEERLEELFAADEQVISILTVRGRGRASGAEVELAHNAGVWTIRDGKIVRLVWFPTREEALEAAVGRAVERTPVIGHQRRSGAR